VPSVNVGVEPSALPAGGVHVRPPPPRLLLPPLSTLSDDLVSLPPLPLPLPLLSKCTSDMLRTNSLETQAQCIATERALCGCISEKSKILTLSFSSSCCDKANKRRSPFRCVQSAQVERKIVYA